MAEAHSAKGRTDLRIDFCNRRIALELKYAPCSANCAELLKSAVSRMKNNNNYKDVLPKKAETVCIALVFDSEERKFSCWKEV